MTVSIDPSEVRADGTSVKPPHRASRWRLPLRGVLIGGLGGAGLIAFTLGAFSFFSGLADPRIRTPRAMPVATAMPDLKDGLPALAPEVGSAAAAQATLNLPRPAPVEPQLAQQAAPVERAAKEPSVLQLRSVAADASDARDAAKQARVEVKSDGIGRGAKPVPTIQNAAVIAETPRIAALVPPARTETVKAKPGGPSTFVSLPAESKPQPEAEPAARQEARKSAAKAPTQKNAAHKSAAAKPVAEAAPAAETAGSHAWEDDDVIPGSRQIRAGLKALGGMFGGSESD